MIRYSPEFKQSLVEMHNQGRSYTELAAEYGPSADSIRNCVQWTQADVNALQNSGINHSYSRKGHPYDNARIEIFHSLIKREMIYHEEYRTIDDVRVSVEWYVNWYNNSRINSRTDWLQTT
ncbi:integrase core domain-containing protein [Leuconostoc mesenteroides]|uniref:integrase core domain-containing protein n=1 Tax=Leuconostoc mesenteroides TaxID=1245 RepID=UPI0013E8D515|nr:integrase core domain-containing protein [Leuconostoc mesenteroides]